MKTFYFIIILLADYQNSNKTMTPKAPYLGASLGTNFMRLSPALLRLCWLVRYVPPLICVIT